MDSGIYLIKNKINNKIYVGSALNIKRRFSEHKRRLIKNYHHNKKLLRAWKKYGENNFEFSILEKTDTKSLIEREQYYLNVLLKADKNSKYFEKNGYNICRTAGNTLFFKFKEESKIKMSKIKIQKNKEKNARFLEKKTKKDKEIIFEEKQSVFLDKTNNFYGKKHSKESKEKMSLAKIGDKNPFYGTKGNMFGKKHSDDAKRKISIKNSGKNNKNSKKVFQYDLNMNLINVFESTGEASRELGISQSNISNCCRGGRRTAYGCIWKYEKLDK